MATTVEVVEITDRLHLIKPAFGQAYVWQDGSRLTLVDTGTPGSEEAIATAFAMLGFRRTDLVRIVITHGHEDHAGSAAALRAWGDPEVLAHHADVPVVEGRRQRANPTLTPREQPLFEQVMSNMPPLPPCRVDTALDDGDLMDFGGRAEVLHTPGHTDGSIAVWLPAQSTLFTGDIVANGTSGLLLGPFNTHRPRARESLVRLSATRARTVCFGHGDPLHGDSGAETWMQLGERCRAGMDAVPDPLG